MRAHSFILAGLVGLSLITSIEAAEPIRIDTPMSPPAWAMLERELLRAEGKACEEFFARYFDSKGYLQCVERWGGDDGPDDAIENFTNWPVLHAIGAPDSVMAAFRKGWEGHLRQYSLAKTKEVELGRDGMYYKEFPTMMDWLHNGEGINPFNMQGLSDPNDLGFRRRVVKFAGLYMNDDPGAPNYDPERKLIRSMFNGSRGPLLRKSTALDWAGDPIEVAHRFRPKHGESSYAQMIAHFRDYNDILGDHPQNLLATTLGLNAYAATGDARYKQWVLEYVGAWRQRMIDNGGIIPTNVGRDGVIGSDAGGKWYGGVYGWGFSVTDPVTGKLAHRNLHQFGIVGFANAFLLSGGDDAFLDPWRKQIVRMNELAKVIDGVSHTPTMHGDKGWYEYVPRPYSQGAAEVAYLSLREDDRRRVPDDGWWAFLDGKDPGYPERALRADLDSVRKKVAGMRADDTTPDTRLADDPLEYNPAVVDALVHLTLGGLPTGNRTGALHARVRYFDPAQRRAGLPEDVAALVGGIKKDETRLTLVNVSSTDAREVAVQGGAYGEHRWDSVSIEGKSPARPVGSSTVRVRLAPGTGATLVLKTSRYAQSPSFRHPWD